MGARWKRSCDATLLLLVAPWGLIATSLPTVVVEEGDDAVLGCFLAPPIPLDDVASVEFTRVDVTPPAKVLAYRDGINLPERVDAAYEGRAAMLEDGLSLKLSKTNHLDSGIYRCYVWFQQLSEGKAGLVELVVGLVSKPLIHVIITENGELVLRCKATDWYPEPELSWLLRDDILPAGPLETQGNQSNGLHTVWKDIYMSTVPRTSGPLVCRATVRTLSQSQQVFVDDVWERPGSWVPGVIAFSCGVILTLLGNLVIFRNMLVSGRNAISRKVRRYFAKGDGQETERLFRQGDPRYGAYGNILGLDSDGASEAFARANKVDIQGVAASELFARRDLGEMRKYKEKIISVANSLSVHPALIAAIISRQSRAGTALAPSGFGNFDSNCYGLMQVNKEYHPVKGQPFSEDHLDEGTTVLIQSIKSVVRIRPTWSQEQQLKGGIAAYIAGPEKIGEDPAELDRYTPYSDFANDVVARAKLFAKELFN